MPAARPGASTLLRRCGADRSWGSGLWRRSLRRRSQLILRMADGVDLVRHGVAEELQELAAATDVQPPLHMPAPLVGSFIGAGAVLGQSGLRVRTRQGRIATVAKLGFVAYAAPGTGDSQHGIASQCA